MEFENTIRILLIDDDEDDSIIIRELLSNVSTQSYELDWRADHDSALNALSRRAFDICLLDFRLGRGSGLDLLKVIAETTRNLPVILLTGAGDHRVDLDAMRAGAADYLPKSTLNPEILERSIRYSIHTAMTQEALQKSRDELETRVSERTRELLTANEALRRSESRYQSSMELTGLLAWTTGGHGDVVEDCPLWRKFTGISYEETRGRGWTSALHPEDVERARQVWEKSVREKTLYETEFRLRRYDGIYRDFLVRGAPLFGEDGGVREWVGACTDITERKKMEKELEIAKEQAERRAGELEALMDAVPAMIWISRDTGCNPMFGNRAVYEFLGMPPGANVSRSAPETERASHFRALNNGMEVPVDELPMRKAATGHPVRDYELEYVFDNGASRMTLGNSAPLRDAAGNVYGAIAAFIDITGRKQAEATIKANEERLHLALDSARAGTWEWDLESGQNFWSEELWNLYGIEPHGCEPSYEAWRLTVHPDDREQVERAVLEASAKGAELRAEWRVKEPGGGERWLMSRGRPSLDATGKPARYVGVVIDITERKRSEIELRNSHQEKVALLKEVHHRVKNNLQIVMSLLGLQADHTRTPETLAMLRDTRNRVRSMALLHETLYRSTNLARISFSDYIGDLCGQIVTSYGQPAQRVKVETRLEEIGLPMDKAVPCGLLVNELVSNAFKHAFPGEREGTVKIELDRAAGDKLLLAIRDDGVGFPPDIDPRNTETLGLQLVFDLARQLQGNITLDRTPGGGVSFRLLFPFAEDVNVAVDRQSNSNPHSP